MSIIDNSIKNLEMALAELKAALQAEQKIEPVPVTNQEQISDEELLRLSDIRF